MPKILDFYYDPVSPYAYLAFAHLPQALSGQSYYVRYCPVFLGGLFQHWGQLGPAEIPPKRSWVYRHVFWKARELGLTMQMPSVHPFNSNPLLCMALQCALQGTTPAPDTPVYSNRFVTEAVFTHVWQSTSAPLDAARLQQLRIRLGLGRIDATTESSEAHSLLKMALRTNTRLAITQGIFGVPSIVADGQLFWGLDALPMLAQYLKNPDAFLSAPCNAMPVYGIGARS